MKCLEKKTDGVARLLDEPHKVETPKEDRQMEWFGWVSPVKLHCLKKKDEWRLFNQVTHTKWTCMKKAK